MLFSGSAALEAKFVAAIAAAPADARPLDAVAAGLDAMADLFEGIGERPRTRQAIIAANPDLQERELVKLIGFAAAARALRDCGVAEPAASFAAEAGIAVLRIAFEQWVSGPKGQDLHALLRDSLAELKAVAAVAQT